MVRQPLTPMIAAETISVGGNHDGIVGTYGRDSHRTLKPLCGCLSTENTYWSDGMSLPDERFSTEYLPIVGTTTVASGLSGCLFGSRSGPISISLSNEDDEQHTLAVEFTQTDETVFSEQYPLSPGDETEVSDASVVASTQRR